MSQALPPQNPNDVILEGPMAPNVFLDSFYFSQGSPSLQYRICEYLHAIYPDLQPPPKQEDFLKRTLAVVNKITLFSPELHEFVDVPYNIMQELEDQIIQCSTILTLSPPPLSQTLESLISEIIERDFRYIEARPRTASSENNPYNPRKDCHLSHLCYYALQGHPAGLPVYTKMFAEIAAYLRGIPQNDIFWETDAQGERLLYIIHAYNKHHPTQEPVLPPWQEPTPEQPRQARAAKPEVSKSIKKPAGGIHITGGEDVTSPSAPVTPTRIPTAGGHTVRVQ